MLVLVDGGRMTVSKACFNIMANEFIQWEYSLVSISLGQNVLTQLDETLMMV